MSFTKAILFFSLILSSVALVTPHGAAHSAHRHHAVAARVPVPEPVAVSVPDVPLIRKRSLGKRCKPRTPPTTSAKAPAVTHTLGAANAGSDPKTSSVQPPNTTSPQTHTKTASAPQSTNANDGNLPAYMIGQQTGQGTFYATGLGACGITNNDSQHICAVSHLLFDTFPGYNGGNPNNNPICGRFVTAHYGGNSVKLEITDRCTGCKITDLDMAPSAFNLLADPAIGRISGMTWTWDDPL